MKQLSNETVTVPFTASGYKPETFYTFTPATDDMFTARIIDSTSYPVEIYWGRADSDARIHTTFNQANDSYHPENMALEAGVAYNFQCGAEPGCTGNIAFTYTPAADTETFFDVPAGVGDVLVSTLIPAVDSLLTVTLLEPAHKVVMTTLKDSAGHLVSAFEFHNVTQNWNCEQTLLKGQQYGLFISNHISTGENLTGYLHLALTPL